MSHEHEREVPTILWFVVGFLLFSTCSGGPDAEVKDLVRTRDAMRGEIEDLRQRVLALEAR